MPLVASVLSAVGRPAAVARENIWPNDDKGIITVNTPQHFPHNMAEVCALFQPLLDTFDFKGIRFFKVVCRAGGPVDPVQRALQPLRTLLYEHFQCKSQDDLSGLYLVVRGGRTRAANMAGNARFYLSNCPDSVYDKHLLSVRWTYDGSSVVGLTEISVSDASIPFPAAAAFRAACPTASLNGFAP